MDDYYKRLGVSRNATIDEIKRAARELQRQVHPDLKDSNTDINATTEASALVNEAYTALRDVQKRQIYDAELNRQSARQSQEGGHYTRNDGRSQSTSSRGPETPRPVASVDSRPIGIKYNEVRQKMAEDNAKITARLEHDKQEHDKKWLQHREEQEKRNREIDEQLNRDRIAREGSGSGGENLG